MAMPRPAPSIVRRPHGAQRLSATQPFPRPIGITPQADQCLGNYAYCSNYNPATPCLTFNDALGFYYCSTCCLP